MKRNWVGVHHMGIWLSGVAIIISLASLWKSCQSTEIAEKSLEVNIQPLLICDFVSHPNGIEVSVQNDGVLAISDVTIFRDVLTVVYGSRDIGGHLSSQKPWQLIPSLGPKENRVFLIDSSDCANYLALKRFGGHADSVLSNGSFIASASVVVSLSFKYRRAADQKFFFVRRSVIMDWWPSHIEDLDNPISQLNYGVGAIVEHFLDSLHYHSR